MTKQRRETNPPISMVKIRFCYDNQVKGVWVNALEALRNGQITANKGFRVTHLEFEREEYPERK